MNKKGSVPVTILVIGVFALCALALITFFISEFQFSNSFAMVDDLRAISVFEDEWHFYTNQGVPDNVVIQRIEFPLSSEISDNYKIEIQLESSEKSIKISRIFGKSFVRNLFSKNMKAGDLVYSIEYKFD